MVYLEHLGYLIAYGTVTDQVKVIERDILWCGHTLQPVLSHRADGAARAVLEDDHRLQLTLFNYFSYLSLLRYMFPIHGAKVNQASSAYCERIYNERIFNRFVQCRK